MRRSTWIWTWSMLGALLITVAVVGIVSAPATAVESSAAKHVTIKNFTFTPPTITVSRDTKVTWKNMDGVQHTVTSTNSIKTTAKIIKGFDSGPLNTGQTFSHTFKKKGSFFYECRIHAFMPSMHGKVIVK